MGFDLSRVLRRINMRQAKFREPARPGCNFLIEYKAARGASLIDRRPSARRLRLREPVGGRAKATTRALSLRLFDGLVRRDGMTESKQQPVNDRTSRGRPRQDKEPNMSCLAKLLTAAVVLAQLFAGAAPAFAGHVSKPSNAHYLNPQPLPP